MGKNKKNKNITKPDLRKGVPLSQLSRIDIYKELNFEFTADTPENLPIKNVNSKVTTEPIIQEIPLDTSRTIYATGNNVDEEEAINSALNTQYGNWKIHLDKDNEPQKFVNPYNFVSLGSSKEEYAMLTNEPFLRGHIDCSLVVKTDLFIPNTSNSKIFYDISDGQQSHSSYEFYSYENLQNEATNPNRKPTYIPIIPASSIRGVLRSVFEASTNSCLSKIDDELSLSKRTSRAKIPGILSFNANEQQWKLYYADLIKIRFYSNNEIDNENYDDYLNKIKDGGFIKYTHKSNENEVYEEGEIVYFTKTIREGKAYIERIAKTKEELKERLNGTSRASRIFQGIIHFTGSFSNKKIYEAICIKNEKLRKESKNVGLDCIERLNSVINDYIDSKKNIIGKKEGELGIYRDYKKRLDEKKDVIVYYDESRNYLSPSCITREHFSNRISHLIGNFKTCSSKDKLCPACILFGMVKNDNSTSGKLRIEDATPSGKYEFDSVKILPFSGMPKLPATEFYLKDTNANTWNYDYALNDRQQVIERYVPQIRGRKFYWHTNIDHDTYTELSSIKGNEEKKNEDLLKTSIRPLKEGTFKFRIFFDGIDSKTLDQLLWCINLGNGQNDTHYHKLGRGKPLGLGSVNIKVDNVSVFNYSIENDSVEAILTPYNTDLVVENEQMKEILIITEFNHPNKDIVDYPTGHAGGESTVYNWFGANRAIDIQNIKNNKIKNRGIHKPVIFQSLPYLTSNRQWLYKYKK